MTEPASIRDPLIGATVGPYFVGQKIGESRWGSIYRALQSSVQRPVALEILSAETAAKPGWADQFREEAYTAAQIAHPHLVSVYEAGYADGHHFCARELMDGPPLERLLRTETGVDERRLVLIISTLADALDLLWLRKAAHPFPVAADIVVNRDGVAKLAAIEPGSAPSSGSPHQDMVALGAALASVVNEIGPVSKPVALLVERMLTVSGREPFLSLEDLAMGALTLAETLPTPGSTAGSSRASAPSEGSFWASVQRVAGRKGG